MVRSLTKRGMPKPFAILIAVLMALYFVPLGALPANAATTGFEIDGNQVNDGSEDWKDLPTPVDGVATDLADSADKTHRVLTTFLDNTVGGQDSTYAGANNKENAGSQWPNWSFTDTGNVAGKSDYGRLAAYSYVSKVGGVDHVFLNLAFDRGSNKGGTATDNYYFELNQFQQADPNNINPKRTTGDIRITINDQGSSVFDPPVVQMWTATSATTGSWGPVTGNNPSYSIAANSAAAISDLASWWVSSNTNGAAHTIDTEGFLEASLDLTSFGAVLGCPSTGFSTLNGRSSTGASDKNLEDYFKASPIHVPSSCANLVINKVDGDNHALGGATFTISPNPLPPGTPGANLANLVIFDDSDNNTTVETGTNYDDPDATAGQITLPAVVPNVEYTITETTPPLGYIGTTGPQPPVKPAPFSEHNQITFTNDLGKAQWEKVDATSKTDICCATFRVQGTGGAAKTLGYDETVKDDNDNNTTLEGSTTVDDKNDAAGLIRLNNLYTGTYTVTETAAPDGYDLPAAVTKAFTITDTTLNTALTGIASNTGTAGAFQDPRLTPDVTAIKYDTSINGGTLPGAVFQLFIDNGVKGTYESGTDVSVSGHGVNPQTTLANGVAKWTDLDWGDYLIVETTAPPGYSLPANPVQAFTVNRANAGDNSRVFNFLDPRKTSTITVTKTDEQGNTITSFPARFGLYNDVNNNSAYDGGDTLVGGTPELNSQWTTVTGQQSGSTVDGTVSWSNLAFGDYVVHELDAPQGYKLPANPDVAFHVTAANAGGTLTGAVKDPKLDVHLTVKKTDAQGNPLPLATFQLWQETNNALHLQTTGTADTLLGNCTTDGTGTCTLPKVGDNFLVTWPNTYYWVEITPPAGYSLPDVADREQQVDVTQDNISKPFSVTVFVDPKPDIVTHADSANLPDGTVTDYADLSGVADDATGTLHFALYGPFDDNSLKGDSCVDSSKRIGSVADITIDGPGRYPTGQGVVTRTVTKQGVYYWYVTYDSANNNDLFGSAVSKCGADNEVVTVHPNVPKITTEATPSATYLAGTINDVVTVRPVTLDATGNLVVSVYGPSQSDAADCTGAAAQSWTVTRSADDSPGTLEYTTTLVSGKYQIRWTTPDVTPTGAGNYFWKATYAGDANNLQAPGPNDLSNCGEISETSHEISHVAKAPSSITTAATANSLITPDGTDKISDEVRVHYGADGARPTGDVTLTLYGPLTGADPATSCATTPQAHQWTLHLADGTDGTDGQGKYVTLTSPDFTPTAPGTYRWATSYEGDKNYVASQGACPDPNEVTRVSKPELDKSSDPTTVASTADGTPTLVPLGSTITYTLTVTNTGDAPIVDKPLVDTLPDEVTFGHVTGSTPSVIPVMDINGHWTLTWSVSLAAGASETFTYTVTVNQDATGGDLLVNVARFLGLEDQTTHRVGVPVPTLDKSSPTDGQLVHVGDTIHYKIVVGNTGNFPITGSALVDTLPDGVTFTSGTATTASTGGGSVDSGPVSGSAGGHNTLTWMITLPAGSTATVEFDALVTGAVPQDANLTNKATFESLLDTTVHHTGHPTPGIDKSSPTDGQLVHIGDTIHYKIKVSNTGDYPITSRPVVDTLPDGVTFIADSDTSSTTGGGTVDSGPTAGTNTLTWVVTLPAGATATVEFDALVTADVAPDANLTNSASFEQLVDTTVHHTGHPTPTLDKSSPNEGATVPLGSTIHYKVVVGNTGDYPITDSAVVDTLPDGVAYVAGSSASETSGGGTASTTPTTGSSGGHNTLTWTVTLPPGADATFRFDVTVNADNPRGAELLNTAAFENLTDQTVHYVGIPNPTLDKFANPATTDASPTIVQPGTQINYSVKVGNTGNFPITNAPVVDTLPNNVSVVTGTISDGGTLSGDGKSITWTVTLAPGDSKTLTYAVKVDQAAPEGAFLVNTAKFQNLTDTTTHVVPTGDLTLVKSVSPVAGHGVVVNFGDKLTYTLTASATGQLDQTDAVVRDTLPGRDPAHPKSGDVTYVAGSAKCIGAGTCTVTGPDANGLITWHLGAMAAGSSRQVTFQVIIKDVTGAAGSTIAEDIINQGTVQSARTPVTPSNVVVTPVSKVLPVKVGPKELPHTGAFLPVGPTVGGGILLLGLGVLLVATTRRRRGQLLG
jgi:fimbrial isopeptide formation D2 family protein/uncharacterized repeat protein (TIGR01451 family)